MCAICLISADKCNVVHQLTVAGPGKLPCHFHATSKLFPYHFRVPYYFHNNSTPFPYHSHIIFKFRTISTDLPHCFSVLNVYLMSQKPLHCMILILSLIQNLIRSFVLCNWKVSCIKGLATTSLNVLRQQTYCSS